MDILIADGDAILLEILKRYFGLIGHRVETATSGIDCLQKLERLHPDVLVLNDGLLWGGSNGVLQEMRKAADLCSIPVVMTSDINTWFNGEALPQVVSCLRKPFRLQCLKDQICNQQLVDRNHQCCGARNTVDNLAEL